MADSLSILALAAALVQESENHQSTPEFYIRKARSTDIPLLEHVERSAAEVFRTVDLGFLLDGPTVDPYHLSSMAVSNHLWVAVNKWDQPIGFLGGETLEGNFHVVEISVSQDFQNRGIGKSLMKAMVEQVTQEGYRAITLTTYRDLPWNGPWYAKMGFVEVKAMEMGQTYLGILDHEAQNGLQIERRCVMRKIL
jgi:GNAT superfamily N-acetyltransferase